MPSYQTKGIVLNRTNLGEADRIVRFLTPDYGKLSAIAKGVRKIKSKAGGHLELFGEVNLHLAKGRNLDIVTTARLAWYPHHLTADYDRLQLAYACGQLVNQVAQEHQAQPELYAHWAETLRAIDGGDAGPLTQLWFNLRLMTLLGYRPQLDGCQTCGRRDADGDYRFDAAHGSLVCAADAPAGATPLSNATVKLWRLLVDYPHATIRHIADGPALASASLPAAEAFIAHHLGR